ncbi:HAD-IA family hydrolase [Aquipuribacter hungaricus]|uniref:HAD-IA family hydrolase n=1 Tax=Aquipuribacter hungaricus TaxID=545624 RepID=A0ABV7WM06_9MICO
MTAAALPARPDAALFDAVLFDMDGTLVDSTPSVVRCWLRLAEENGITPEALQAAAGHGRPARDIVADLFEPPAREAALVRITHLEVTDLEGVVALPGAADALLASGDRGAIVTSCTAPLATARQQAAGIPVPAVVVTADDVVRGKPDPEPFLTAARILGVDPSRCLVVEDAPAGLAAGRAAGMTTLAVTTTHTAEELDADHVVGDLSGVRLDPSGDGVRLHLV